MQPRSESERVLFMWDSTDESLSGAMGTWSESGQIVRAVRGSRMRTASAALDEFSAALQFPSYFGGNKDAFDECMDDLDAWLPTERGFVIVIREFDETLADAGGDREWLFGVLSGARLHYSTPIPEPAPWSRSALSFEVVGHRPSRGPGDRRWSPKGWTIRDIDQPDGLES